MYEHFFSHCYDLLEDKKKHVCMSLYVDQLDQHKETLFNAM